MIKRTIEVAKPSYLHLKNQQLIIEQDKLAVASVPIEDIGVLILEHPAIVITQCLIISCSQNNVVIIFCDEKHLPYSTILPIAEGNKLHQKILQQQINITKPRRKNLWQQIIQTKIKNQANVLKKFNKNYTKLTQIANTVKSSDSTNREGVAAQYYWKTLFGKHFVRDQNLEGINSILNYGYSLIRAMVARSIVAGGLHPSIGLFHHNQYNTLCLADDLMEPFRPLIDAISYNLYLQNSTDLNQANKTLFLKLLSAEFLLNDKSMPLIVAMHYFIANLRRCYIGEDKKLLYPVLKE